MNNMKSNKGLTLIEIIVTIGILSIVTLLLLSIFARGFSHIYDVGSDTKDLFNTQEDMEVHIVKEDSGNEENIKLFSNAVDVKGLKVIDNSLITFIPSAPSIPLTDVTITSSDFSLSKVGEVEKIEYVVTPSDATEYIDWRVTPDNEAVVRVDSNGVVEAKGEGFVTITPFDKDGNRIGSDSITVTIVFGSDPSLADILFNFTPSNEKNIVSLYFDFAPNLWADNPDTSGVYIIHNITVTVNKLPVIIPVPVDENAEITILQYATNLNSANLDDRTTKIKITAPDGSREDYYFLFNK